MKDKLKLTFMKVAESFSELSHSRRLKVGAIVVKNDSILSIGYNGMPAGWDNNCEYTDENGELRSYTEVIHAEANCLGKLSKATESSEGAALFTTHSPCLECAKHIHAAGISNVYYRNDYRLSTGIDFLKKCDISVEKI